MMKNSINRVLEVLSPEKSVSAKLKTSKVDWAPASMNLKSPDSRL